MLIGTHVCLPIFLSGLLDLNRTHKHLPVLFSRESLILIGIGGALPDLLSIHLSLAARHASFTHTVWFVFGLLPLLFLTIFKRFRRFWATWLMAWLGTVMHLFCDSISGGIPMWGPGFPIVGRYYIPPAYWWFFDCAAILSTWFIFFRIRFLNSGGTLVSKDCSWEEKILENWRKNYVSKQPEPPNDKNV